MVGQDQLLGHGQGLVAAEPVGLEVLVGPWRSEDLVSASGHLGLDLLARPAELVGLDRE